MKVALSLTYNLEHFAPYKTNREGLQKVFKCTMDIDCYKFLLKKYCKKINIST